MLQDFKLGADVEKINIINGFLAKFGLQNLGKYRKINMLVATPKTNLEKLLCELKSEKWWGRFISDKDISSMSFFYFSKEFALRLSKAGYEDAKAMHDDLEKFFNHAA